LGSPWRRFFVKKGLLFPSFPSTIHAIHLSFNRFLAPILVP
jgi:hypothetical protein